MLLNEQAVEMAAQMYSARKSLLSLFKDDFYQRCAEWQEVIRKVMAIKGLAEIEAAIDILKSMQGREAAQMWILAAVVEMIEPSRG